MTIYEISNHYNYVTPQTAHTTMISTKVRESS